MGKYFVRSIFVVCNFGTKKLADRENFFDLHVCYFPFCGAMETQRILYFFTADGPRYEYTNMSKLDGVNGTELNVSVGLMANPPVDKDFTWTLNGKKLSDSSNVQLMPGDLQFSPLLVGFEGNYSVKDCNNISCESLHFEFAVYCKSWGCGCEERGWVEHEVPGSRGLTCNWYFLTGQARRWGRSFF